ncbi:MAG: aminoacyl-histidine dipeptidase [Desulfobacteraceae bacterium]|jgi:dipeptidase D
MTDPTTVILHYFEEINTIPRCSQNEAELCRWLQKWAADRDLYYVCDEAGNLLIQVPSSSGLENAPTVVLQGHMDMVCEKTPDSDHDFNKDPIISYREGEWLTAAGTTLGADNGIAIAYMLALVEDDKISHPPLELLFTVDEETGLNGAKRLQSDFIQGRILINLDSEDEGVFTIGCAGGVDTTISLGLETAPPRPDGQCHALVVGGLKGGHSGIDIHKHRGNANRILARTLAHIHTDTPMRIISIDGGSRKNAIPRDAMAAIWTDASRQAEVEKAVAQIEQTIKAEFAKSDKGLFITLKPPSDTEAGQPTIVPEATDQILRLLLSLPTGVAHMSPELEGVVETSCNLATVRLNNGALTVVSSQRSAAVSRLDEITASVHAVAQLAEASVKDQDAYPPWQPQLDSALLSRSKKTYRMLYQQEPVIQVIHAGLECAVIGDLYTGMDMISFGPTIRDPHSPAERIWIPSIEKVWTFLGALLEEISR